MNTPLIRALDKVIQRLNWDSDIIDARIARAFEHLRDEYTEQLKNQKLQKDALEKQEQAFLTVLGAECSDPNQ